MPLETVLPGGDADRHEVWSRNGAAWLWPVYQTAEILMARLDLGSGAECAVRGGALTYFLFVETGTISVVRAGSGSTIGALESIVVPEGVDFAFAAAQVAPTTRLVLVAGFELLPGAFFNALNVPRA